MLAALTITTYVVAFLRNRITALDRRVYGSVSPIGSLLPSAVVDSTNQDDAGLERANVTIRSQDEEAAGSDTVATLATLTAAVDAAMTGDDPAFSLPGYDVLDVALANSLSYVETDEGRRYLRSVSEFEVLIEKEGR